MTFQRSSPKSSPPPSMKSATLGEARQKVLSWEKGKPLLIGPLTLSLGIGWSLAKTEALLLGLVEEDLFRLLTKEELREHGISEGYVRT